MDSPGSDAGNPIIHALKQRILARAAPRLAHDLNNDLTIISGQAELAQRRGDLRLHDRMEQIKLAARSASERNQLLQQLALDEADAGEQTAGADIGKEVQRVAALLTHRDLALTTTVQEPLPAIDRTRLRWIIGALLLAALPAAAGTGSRISVGLTRGGGGLRLDCQAAGSPPAQWLASTLACCATAADVTTHEDGWRALILLAEAL